MRIAFLTSFNLTDINDGNIYADMIRTFIKHGVSIDAVCPMEGGTETCITDIGGGNSILYVKTGKVQKTSAVTKGIETLLLGIRMKQTIKKHLKQRYDAVLYSTPTITLATAAKYIKKRDGARSYLLLKDIFPQNAVDVGMMSKTGVKGLLYRCFKKIEKKLYKISDYIGCMSPANVEYLLKHEPWIDPKKVHVSPNAFCDRVELLSQADKMKLREKFSFSTQAKIFVYGGNVGRPQNADFIVECMRAVKNIKDSLFLIVGGGTDFCKLEQYARESGQENLIVKSSMPRNEYELLVGCCDVGLLFLDYNFTIPNFPSRMLSYMQKGLPILACTDRATDVGKVICEGEFGWWCPSDDAVGFAEMVRTIMATDTGSAGVKGSEYLRKHYESEMAYDIIMTYIAPSQHKSKEIK